MQKISNWFKGLFRKKQMDTIEEKDIDEKLEHIKKECERIDNRIKLINQAIAAYCDGNFDEVKNIVKKLEEL